MSNISFPVGIAWTRGYMTGGDFVPVGTEADTVGNLYRNALNNVIRVDLDTSKVVDMSYMFSNCLYLTNITQFDTSNAMNMSYMFDHCPKMLSIPQLDTSKVTDMSHMFYECRKLAFIPQLDTSKVTSMNRMFYYCANLASIPQLDTSKVTDMSYMFYECQKLLSIPQLDTSKVTDMSYMFSHCTLLKELPDFNCVKVTNFGPSAAKSWLNNVSNIKKIGIVDCDSVTNIGYFFGNGNRNYLTEFGGCRNLGKASTVSNTNSNYFLYYAPNLTYESVMNVINLLYDRASAGLSVLTLKLHPNHLAVLSEDDIAVATNKGWTLV